MPQVPPASLVERIQTSLKQADPAQDEALCTVVGWMSDYSDAARAFMAQLRRKGLKIAPLDGVISGQARAAVPVQIVSSAPIGVPVFLLAHAAGPTAWALEAVTRSPDHARHFVAGRLPALLRWSDLPESPELAAVGAILLDEAAEAAAQGGTPPFDSPVLIELAQRLGQGQTLTLVGTAIIQTLGRGAVTFQVDLGDDQPQDWTVILSQRQDGVWEPVAAEWARRLGTLLDTKTV